MRTATTLVGLTLFALAGTARAQEPAPAAASAAPPAGEPASAPAAAAEAAPATTAPAPVVASQAEAPAAPQRKLQVGLAFLPMGLGTYKYSQDTLTKVTSDAAFAYGVCLSAGYEVLSNLIVGLAPQVIFNVKEKEGAASSESGTQIDLLARIAYALPIVDGTSVYAEVLPGYSLIRNAASPAGFVVGFGAGVAMDMTDRFFVNIGAGYQIGFQTWKAGPNTLDNSTRYLRVALGGGVKL